MNSSKINISFQIYTTANTTQIINVIDNSLHKLWNKGIEFSDYFIMIEFKGKIGNISVNVFMSSPTLPLPDNSIYILNSLHTNIFNSTYNKIKIGSRLEIDLRKYKIRQVPPELKEYLRYTGYIPSGNILDLLIIPEAHQNNIILSRYPLYPRRVYFFGKLSNANATLERIGRLTPIIRDYYDYISIKRIIINTFYSEARSYRVSIFINDLPLLEDKLWSVNKAYDLDMTTILFSQYVFYILLIIFIISGITKILKPIYRKEWLLFSSLGVERSRYSRSLIIISTILIIISYILIHYILNHVLDAPLTLHSSISKLIKLTPILHIVLIIVFVIISILTIIHHWPSPSKGKTLVILSLLFIVYIIAYQRSLVSIAMRSLWSIVPALSMIGLLLIILLTISLIKHFSRKLKIFTNVWGLALFTGIILSLLVLPIAEYNSYYHYEEQLTKGFIPGWIHNVTLLSHIEYRDLGKTNQFPYYFVTDIFIVSIGNFSFTSGEEIPGGGAYPVYIVKFIPSHVVFVNKYLMSKLGLTEKDVAIYIPAPYRVKRELIMELSRYNGSQTKVVLGIGEPTEIKEKLYINSCRVLLREKPFPFWINPNIDPTGIPPTIFTKVAVPYEPIMVIPTDNKVTQYLLTHNQSGVLGIINAYKAITRSRTLFASASTMLIINYDKLRDQILNGLSIERGRSIELLIMNSVVILVIAGIAYISEWISMRSRYKLLLESLGIDEKHIFLLELYSFLLILGISFISSSLLIYYLLLIFKEFLLLFSIGAILLIASFFLSRITWRDMVYAWVKRHS